MGQKEQCTMVTAVQQLLPRFPSVFYIHYVLLFPMKLVGYSSALWQIRCAVKWRMTESSGRLHPLQSYPAITIPSFLWGNIQGQERKLDQIFTEERARVAGGEDETVFFLRFYQSRTVWGVCPEIKRNAVFVDLNMFVSQKYKRKSTLWGIEPTAHLITLLKLKHCNPWDVAFFICTYQCPHFSKHSEKCN